MNPVNKCATLVLAQTAPYTKKHMDDNTNTTNPTPQPPQPLPPTPAPVQPPAPVPPLSPEAQAAPVPPAQPVVEPVPQVLGAPISPAEEENESGPSTLQSTANSFISIFAGIFSWVIFPLLIVLVLHNFVFQAYHVVGTSMAATLQPSDYLIISKVGYTKALVERAFKKDAKFIPGRGEIIVFHYPRDPSEVFVKRVIGLPGDRVLIKDGKVTVFTKGQPGGFNPDTKYEKDGTTTLIDTDEIVPAGSVFVMGDNRSPGGSYDSREWGDLESSYIIGNAVLRLLPLDQAKVL